ncbi:MAG: hypothetical protein H7301_15160 [Cryobacterium sp.]|nr:hypothetical protein [Oligoflexia bacterium]
MSDRLTLVVFKDHLSSRTLTLRLSWLRGLGIALLSAIGLTVVSAALFFHAYRQTLHSGTVGSSAREEDAEKELAETKAAYESLKQQAVNSASSGGSTLAGIANSFSSLPSESLLEKLPPIESLPFRLETLKAQWKGSTLQIRSAIEYSRDDGGNQQGHFVILVHGPQLLQAYPAGVFNPIGTTSLIRPDGGEFFSVSRYREIKADFGPFAHRDDVQSIEMMIFDSRKRLVYLNRIGLESLGKAPAAPLKKIEKAPEPEEPRAEEGTTPPSDDTPSNLPTPGATP